MHLLFLRVMHALSNVQRCVECQRASLPRRHHNARYFALVPDAANTSISAEISYNTPVVFFPTLDGDAFIRNVETAWLPGTTLAIDFVYPAYPSNHGHWTEALFPMIKALSDGTWSHHVQGDGVDVPVIGMNCFATGVQLLYRLKVHKGTAGLP